MVIFFKRKKNEIVLTLTQKTQRFWTVPNGVIPIKQK